MQASQLKARNGLMMACLVQWLDIRRPTRFPRSAPWQLDTSHRYLPYCMEKPSEIAV